MKGKHYKTLFTLAILMLLMVPQGAWATTAYVSTYAELHDAISDASIDVIIVTANIDVPCETSVTSTSTPNYTGSATAQLVIGRSLTLQSQAGNKYTIKRISASGQTSNILKSIFSIKGDGNGNSGTENLTENHVAVTFKNIVIDGGADWGESEYCDRYTAATTAYGNAGRSMIDIFLGGTLNLEDGVVLQNGYTTYSINSVVNNSGSANYGGAVRVEYHANYGGGTVNVKAGAIIHDCTASGYGGALGAYNFARLNLYGGTIYNCSSGNGGAIATTYRSGSDKTKSGTVKMYGGIIRDCCATNGGAISMDGEVSNFLLGGTIENCSASTKGSAICINGSGTTVNIVAYTSHLLTITNCTGGDNTSTGNTNGYAGVYKNESATIADYPVYHVTFQNNNTTFAVLSVAQGTSLGEAFPAAPVNASFRFVGWFNGDTQVTSTTVINSNITVTAKWDFLGSGTLASPYEIPSTDAWNFLADNVNNGNTYSGKYFQLTNDITVTTMVTATFSGTFDGGGHTLTFNYTATGDNAAPFAYITGATIKNLRVAGTINSGYKFAAGIVAISNGGSIENCRSSVTIDSSTSGDGTHGGLVADSYQGTLDINNCLFDGKLLGENTESCGGIVGWRKQGTLNITNTLFAPAEVTVQGDGGAIFARNGATSLPHCYYISDWSAATVQGTNANSMTAEALVAALNNGTKNWCVHRGNAIPVMVNLVINNKTEWDNFSSHAGNYENKYVQLNADISNITAMTSGTFKGIFDGNGHTLTVNLSGGGDVAPFYYLYGGTIMNLTVTGTVTGGANYCSGLVARTNGGVCLIDNCVVNTNNTGVGFVGGVVAHADNATSLTISNCIYGGTIAIQPNGNDENYSGGILGWYNNDKTLDLVMTNCLFKGDYTGNGQFHPIGVKKWAGIFKSINCTNCYYTKNPANIDDAARRTFTDGTKVSELTIGTTGVSIASGSYATFQGTKYYYGTITLGYNGPMATTNFSLDGTHLNDNSFIISTDNAAFDDGTATIKWDFPGRGTVEDPYQISSAAVWDFLADEVSAGNTYSGKFFQLTEDIGTEQNPITRMIGIYSDTENEKRPFSGTFDGNGHTITVNYSGNDHETRTALFSYVKVATICNLIVAGNIGSAGRAAGIVGESDESDGLNIITNCVSSVTISGGLVGGIGLGGNVDIRGCLFNGTINGTSQSGGIVCWGKNVTKITNCLFAPQNGSSIIGGTFYYNGSGSATVTNCYYMTLLGDAQGKQARSITAGTNVTISGLGDATATYNVSGIIAYSHGIKYNTVYYAGSGDAVSLNLGYTPHSGYSFHSFTASAGTLTGSGLAMPDANVTINARYSASKDINKYTQGGHDGWYLISSPIGTVNPANVTNMTSNTYDIFRFNQNPAQNNAGNYLELENWNEPNSESINHNHFDLVPGRGYLYANSANVTLTFIGTPYSGDGVVNLEYSTANPDSRMHGWNLIGNPFGVVSTVDKASLKMNADRDGFEAQTEGASVAAMEGVFVQATATGQSATFTVPTRGSEKAVVARTNIMVSGDKGKVLDNAIIRFDDGEALGKFQLRESSTKVYIPVDGKDYAIANADDQGEIPVNFKAEKNGSYTLSFSNENIDFGYLHLIDNKTGADVDLLAQPSYTFEAKTTDYESRFLLVFSANGPSTDSGTDEPFAFFANGEWIILNEGEATLQVIDLTGRILSSETVNGSVRKAINAVPGVYILRMINGEKVRTQKIVVR